MQTEHAPTDRACTHRQSMHLQTEHAPTDRACTYRQSMHLQTEHAPTDWDHAYHQALLESSSSCRRACTHIQGPNRRQSHSEMQYLHERQMQIGITLMKFDIIVRVTASQRACRYTHIHSLCKLLTAQNGIGGCGTDQHGGSAHSTCNVVDPQTYFSCLLCTWDSETQFVHIFLAHPTWQQRLQELTCKTPFTHRAVAFHHAGWFISAHSSGDCLQAES